MEVFAAVVVASLAYVCAPLVRVHVARRLRLELPAGVAAPGSDPVLPLPIELSAEVAAWCAQESADWAQDEARATARQLYAVHGDWSTVLQELERGA